jgi:RHS repeat-associated protein
MTYLYNGLGEQVRKYTDTDNRYMVYDESGHWLGEYDSNGATIQQAIWMDDLPVGVLVSAGAQQKLHYVEPDHLGTPRVVIDPVRNVAVWNWDLKGEAFGNSAPNQDPDLDGTAFVFDMRFPGQRFDSLSRLNYNYFRDYDASTGRYSQSDPVGLAGAINTYAYVRGNPISRIDPFGLKDYLACETKKLMDKAKAAATNGSFATRTNAVASNHSEYGIDGPGIGTLDIKIRYSNNDTFTYGGRSMSNAQFGNYIAGYAGYYYGGSYGLAAMMWGGVLYDFKDNKLSKFRFDLDSRDDIADGARRARLEIENGLTTCGCGQ